MLCTPIAGLTPRTWSSSTAAGLRRRLINLIEEHIERKLITRTQLEAL
jgi:hypothetical protein